MARKNKKPHRKRRESESELNNIRLKELGVTWKELAEATGCCVGTLISLNNGTRAPLYEIGKRRGQPKAVVSRLCLILGKTIGEVFPRYVCDYRRENLDILDMEDLIIDADVENIQAEPAGKTYPGIWSVAFRIMSRREVFIIKKRFIENITLEQVSGLIGISRERVRQIEARAIRKIKNDPWCFKKLQEISLT